MKVLIATKNKGKIKEFTRIFESMDIIQKVELLTLNDFEEVIEPIEDGKTFYENALIKAKYYYELFRIPVISDDTGLVVDALNGEPGIYSARYASNNGDARLNREKLLKNLYKKSNRDAYFECSIVYYDGNFIKTEIGRTYGYILKEEIDGNGFGYDSIFYSKNLEKPFSLATPFEKDSVSHRGIAFRALIEKLFNN